MRVVKQGNSRMFETVCGGCQSILEYTTGDIRRSPIVWPDGSVSKFSVKCVVCPVCGKDVGV